MSDPKKSSPFVLAQLEEALEERQTPDRRKKKAKPVKNERRKGDRRSRSK